MYINKLIARAGFLLALILFIVFPPVISAGGVREADTAQDVRADPISDGPASGASNYRQRLGKTIVKEEDFFSHELDTYVRYMPSRGAAAQAGRISIVDSATEYSYTVKVLGGLPVEFGLGAKYIGIANTTSVKLPPHLTRVSFGVETTVPFLTVKDTYFTVGLAPMFSTDNWGVRSSALSLTQRYFLIRQASDSLTLIAGVFISPHENDPIMPILGFIYKPNDKLTFNIIPKQPEISYKLNDKLTLFSQADITMDEYRVDKEGLKNIALEYNEIHAGAGLRYKANENIQGNIVVGGVFNRSIKYRRDDYGKITVKNGVYTELRIDIKM
ncbi:MAG: DUF6268 family outer membrane beta-barrel protein [Candidatus Omnitrophica bacterium]|nr:DUF6268 family outer membrane beta-barrel protein [Candidatus Omnitrophota bacterium]MDD5771165.1 DUF6268 family outer membrane beta-barrel protein [Candidatus Omnitrophota bacterium]